MTRPASVSTPGWSQKTIATIAIVSAVSLVSIAIIAFLLWRGDGGASQAMALADQLLHADPTLPVWQRNRLLTQLMRTIDEMDRDNRRAVQEHWRAAYQTHLAGVLAEYRVASKPQQDVILDREIQYMRKSRAVDDAIHNGPRGRGGRGRGGNRVAGRPAATGGGRQRPRNPEMTPERQERVAFYQALEARAEKTGHALDDR